MDAFNRYVMRRSGEARHQAQGPAEAATFVALDVLHRRGRLDLVLTGTEAEKSALVDEIVADVDRAPSRRTN